MTQKRIYSALSFNKAFYIGLAVAILIHIATLLNPYFKKQEISAQRPDSPVMHAEKVYIAPPPPPEAPPVVKKVVRAKIIPKVVEKPVEEQPPEPEPIPEPVTETAPVAVAEPVVEAPPLPPVVKEPPKPSADSIKMVTRTYLRSLKKQLEQIKDYPATAKRLKQEGTVRVRFTILADGKIEQIEVSESSRYSSLDNSALEAVANMGKFQPIPKLLEKERWRIEIPIQYKLNAGRS
ncbi:energy transducer TonB [Fibrobacter succinogenes]|uniref:Outer membrane transport energization protein TonB (TC 2.C.1.1.1) n=1 Tax=Fibrobacter succinogenes TaxID=833 RepID=A0A380S5X9_FIBSU|nr:energy transducer TonB [Fibrobacter succinogenes]PWJ35649.1 protein TonB [Fibrobacter succinogenes subsp. elongatus]SUQ24304.1 outer membrane transport energization protein TonB (TC 2.C.1.1.1) [Fibrobacter succinogenes]